MESSALYALIGALGGVMITQITNYFLENKKSKNLKDLKSLELEYSQHNDLLKERRLAYSKYLQAVDQFVSKQKNLPECIGDLYSALIVSSEETTKKINDVFSIIKQEKIDTEKFLDTKKELLIAMQKDLQKLHLFK